MSVPVTDAFIKPWVIISKGIHATTTALDDDKDKADDDKDLVLIVLVFIRKSVKTRDCSRYLDWMNLLNTRRIIKS